MSIDRLLGAVMDGMSVESLIQIKAGWEKRLETAKATGTPGAVKVCERMIGRYEELIEARGGGKRDADDHGL